MLTLINKKDLMLKSTKVFDVRIKKKKSDKDNPEICDYLYN